MLILVILGYSKTFLEPLCPVPATVVELSEQIFSSGHFPGFFREVGLRSYPPQAWRCL